jgi:hypothetical protein
LRAIRLIKLSTMVAGAECQETLNRIEGERLTLAMSSKSATKLDAGRRPIEESPLFGGQAQQEMF